MSEQGQSKKITKEELLRILRENDEENGGDYEAGHSEADAALLDYIADDEVREAYERVGKWYG